MHSLNIYNEKIAMYRLLSKTFFTNPSINADKARVNNGVIVTVKSEAGNIPPYFRTTKIEKIG